MRAARWVLLVAGSFPLIAAAAEVDPRKPAAITTENVPPVPEEHTNPSTVPASRYPRTLSANSSIDAEVSR